MKYKNNKTKTKAKEGRSEEIREHAGWGINI